ncbi:MAG: ABC transporter ATP-binding protein [Planctomycetota bacterium]|nr:ABC transporter ATP-binding protein [Planctomycetota bacterium]
MSPENREVSHFTRILPYVWPSRRRLFVSFFLAGLVAFFWGAILSIAYPVVKVLLEGKAPAICLQELIDGCELQISEAKEDLEHRESEVATDSAHELSLLRKKARAERKLTTASQRLALYRWVEVYAIPLLPADLFRSFAIILGIILLLTVAKLACMFAEEVLVGSVVEQTVMRLRKACFRKVLTLDYQTLKMQGTSDLMSRLTYDIEALGSGLGLLGGRLVREPLKAIACLCMAFWVNWQLTLLSILFVPVAGVVFHRIGKSLKKASTKSMESVARIYQVLEESFESIKVVIAFNGGRRQRQVHHRESKQFYRRSMRIVMTDALTSPTTEMLGMVAVVMGILPGAYLVLRGETSIFGIPLASEPMDVAELSMMYTLLAGILDPVRKLSSIFSKLKRSAAAADRVFQLMDTKSLVVESARPVEFPQEVRQVEFRDVGFTFASQGHARPTVLDGVTLNIAAGEVVAVVGENGSGKSTLVNLIPRFYDPDRGSVNLNGIDLRDFALRDLRLKIGFVTQETLLFDDTIAENIRCGNPEATRAQIEEAAERASVKQFLDQMPDGLETRVGAKGASLSGGQRQRIALARAILRNPGILILDEATSAIDALSERLIHQSLERFVKGRTVFLITHSITDSLLSFLTRIVVLERGRVVANGTHSELLRDCSTYRRLYHARDRASENVVESGDSISGASKSVQPEKSGEFPRLGESPRTAQRDAA